LTQKYISNGGTGELDIAPGQEHKKTWLDKHEAKLAHQPTLPFKPEEIKPSRPKPYAGSPIKGQYFYDTKKGIDFFTNLLKEESNIKLTSQRIAEIDKLGKEMKKSVLKYHESKVKKIEAMDPTTYPSNQPDLRGRLLEIERLEKDLEPEKKKPSAWPTIYKSMTPLEKGQWNAEQRRKNQEKRDMNHEPTKDLNKDIAAETNRTMNRALENIRQIRLERERLKKIPEVKFEIKKEPPAGLHETFTKDKLLEGSILKQIEEEPDEKI